VESAEIRNSIESLDLPTSAATGVFEARAHRHGGGAAPDRGFSAFFRGKRLKTCIFQGNFVDNPRAGT